MKNNPLLLAVAFALLLSGCAQKGNETVAGDQEEDDMKNATAFGITSSAYSEGGEYPEKYTCDGQGINPPLAFRGIPAGTKTLALVFDDPDAPGGTYDHWVMWNISPVSTIEENSVPTGSTQGMNSDGTNKYDSPCPPSGTHRYVFHAYALDAKLNLPGDSGKPELEKAMKGRILASATLNARYGKK
jgi:hypothetical protein